MARPLLIASTLLASVAVGRAHRSVDPYVSIGLSPHAEIIATWGPNPTVFTSHMVLHSNDAWSGGVTPARIWGSAEANETVTVSGLPDGAVVSPSNPFAANASGFWSITISTPPSQMPVKLSFLGASGSSVALDDVLFGAVFLCSGQSNMDMDV